MVQRSSPLYGLPRTARREIELLLATDPDPGDDVEQETFTLDCGSLDPDDQLSLKQMFEIGFRGLTPREERVLRLRYGLAGVGCHTYKEIADEFDTTGARIHHIEMRAHHKLIKRWSCRKLWSAADTRRRESNVAPRRPKASRPIGPLWGLYDDAHGRPLPFPVPHVPAPELAGLSEETHSAARAKPAALHVVPRPSLLSRIWNWVPGGRVGHGGFDLDSLFSSRRR